MTTKRKQLLKAIALAIEPTIDDLQTTTGMQRKNLADNLKTTVKDGLIERVKDDGGSEAAAKPAIAAKNNVTPQPAVGKNTGSKAVGPRVAGGSMIADPLPASNAVAAPPDQPMQAPVDLVSADVMDLMQRNADLDVRLNSAGKSIVDFCEWLAIRAKVRVPMNLHESKQVIESLVKSQPSAKAEVRALEDRISVMSCQLDDANNEAARLKSENIALSTLNASMPGFGATFAALKQSDLPAGVTLKTPQPNSNPVRYIVADSYTIRNSPKSANEYALNLATNLGMDSPVIVFETTAARELRINWSDV